MNPKDLYNKNVYKEAVVLEGCSRLIAGTEVELLKFSKCTNEYWCRRKDGQTCYWIKAELLEVKE